MMRTDAGFAVVYLEEARNFLSSIPAKAREKLIENVDKSMYLLDPKFFKKMSGTDIWEFRTLFNGIQYRLFAFWDNDGDALVIATHGFIKKTRKTPIKELKRAEYIRKLYFDKKYNGYGKA